MKEVQALSHATGDESVLEIIYTTNKATSGNDTGLKVTQTDLASPGISRLIDLLTGVVRHFSVNNAGFVENSIGANVASATTITPTGPIFHVTGVTQVNTINVPYAGFSGSIIIIPDGIFALGTSGNIALATTTTISKPILLVYDTNTSKWYQNDIPLATESLAGEAEIATQVETDAGTDDARMVSPLKLKANIASKAFYNVQLIFPPQNPPVGQTVAVGMYTASLAPVFAVQRVYMPKAGRITRCYGYWRTSGTAGSNESIAFSLRLNNTTDTAVASVASTAADKIFSNVALNIAVAEGDYIEGKFVLPTWGTPPTNCYFFCNVIIEPSA
jgi:hypothetical protein